MRWALPLLLKDGALGSPPPAPLSRAREKGEFSLWVHSPLPTHVPSHCDLLSCPCSLVRAKTPWEARLGRVLAFLTLGTAVDGGTGSSLCRPFSCLPPPVSRNWTWSCGPERRASERAAQSVPAWGLGWEGCSAPVLTGGCLPAVGAPQPPAPVQSPGLLCRVCMWGKGCRGRWV